jgi:hypothetical protein
MSLHLILAAFWLVVGVAMLVGLWLRPAAGLRFGGDGIPLGAVALLFAGYNLVRWYGRRRTPRPIPAAPTRRPAAAPEDREPRPEFDFSRAEPPDPPPTTRSGAGPETV